MRKYLAAAMFLVLAFTAPAALADTLSFSFSVTGNESNGSFTGTIEGLQDNATSAATAIYIDTDTNAPDELLPYNVLGGPISATTNSFTVTNGVITGFDFRLMANRGDPQEPDFDLLSLDADFSGDILHFQGDEVIVNDGGLNGVTFQLLSRTAATPEPGSIALLGTGLAWVMAFGPRRLLKS